LLLPPTSPRWALPRSTWSSTAWLSATVTRMRRCG
jgi:hypothetical protein